MYLFGGKKEFFFFGCWLRKMEFFFAFGFCFLFGDELIISLRFQRLFFVHQVVFFLLFDEFA